MFRRPALAFVVAGTLLLVSTSTTPVAFGLPLRAASVSAAEANLAVAGAATRGAPGAAGHDYATDTFGDPWDYSNTEDLLLDDGPAINASNPQAANGWARMWFTDNGYVSPIWGGYGGPLFIGRDGGKPGNALDTSRYRTVSFQAYSSRDVAAGLFWFNCPGGSVASDCGGGVPFQLKLGWNTYVLNPAASVYGGWPVGWGGSVNGLRLAVSPGAAGSDFALDWFRVTEPNSGASVAFSDSAGGAGDLIWDGDSDPDNNVLGQSNWGVLAQVAGGNGQADLSALPAGSYRVGVRRSGVVNNWTTVTLSAPLPRILTPNAVGDRDYATTVLGNPWDMDGPGDVAGIGNATDVTFAGGELGATNTSNDPFVSLRVGAGGIDPQIYHNLTVTSAYDGRFDLRDIAGGGTMARVMWDRADGGNGQSDDILTYSGTRTVTFDLGLPVDQLVEPGTGSAAFLSSSAVTAFRWDPNEDRGGRRWWLKDVQLRSDFASNGSFPIQWQDAAYTPGSTARLIADTDRTGCDGISVADGIAVGPGTNTTVWNTSGVPAGRYWLCLIVTKGGAVTSGYAGGVVVVGNSAPVDANPAGWWDGGTVSDRTYQFAGWAFDPNGLRRPIDVDIIDVRPDGSTATTRFTADQSRPDVAKAYPNLGGNTGFAGSIQLVGAGRHVVCAMAVNVGPGENRWLHCGDTIDVPGPSGYLDRLTSDQAGTLGLIGWAADPDGPSAVEDLHLYVTGPAGTAKTVVHTGQSRADVHRALPWVGPDSGFVATVPTQGEGVNMVCAYAINLKPPATNPGLGCQSVDVRNAFGFLDTVTASGGKIISTGWAVNPNRPSEAVEVHIYDIGPSGTKRYTGFFGNQARPDVDKAFPGYGAAHGFSNSIPANGAGSHTVCVYAITTGGGTGNPWLGCQTVTVR